MKLFSIQGSSLALEGGLSGRTAAVRTQILQSRDIIEGYGNEIWFGKPLNTDDDNFITRPTISLTTVWG